MYLGLDCGTSGLKALLTDEGGEAVASAARSYSPDRPRAGWSEQYPDDWATAMAGAIADLRNSAGKALGALKAIGFSGQMHGAVLLDRADKPIRPAILHNDGRAFLEADELARDYPDLAQVVGVKPMPGFTGPKLKWIARARARQSASGQFAAVAEGLFASQAQRRKGVGHERRGGNMASRRGPPRLVARSVRRV